jgi:hypothetical protein
MGIEPTLAAWEAAVLPLNYTRAGASLRSRRAAWQRRLRSVAAAGRIRPEPLPMVSNTLASVPSRRPRLARAEVVTPPASCRSIALALRFGHAARQYRHEQPRLLRPARRRPLSHRPQWLAPRNCGRVHDRPAARKPGHGRATGRGGDQPRDRAAQCAWPAPAGGWRPGGNRARPRRRLKRKNPRAGARGSVIASTSQVTSSS